VTKRTHSGWHQSIRKGRQVSVIGGYGEMETYTGTTVLDGSVRARELSKVVASHLGLDLDGVEDLSNALVHVYVDLPYDAPCRCRCQQHCQSSRER